MAKTPFIFISPAKYIQGAGAILSLGEHIKPLGSRVLVLGGNTGLETTRAGRRESFAASGITQSEEPFIGESTEEEITRIAKLAESGGFDVIMACGGGKAIDTAKAAASQTKKPVVIVPTVASNDSPCSSISVVYNHDGSFNRLLFLGRNPDLVLVDTEIIAKSPVRQLISGMGDALATYYEADAGFRSGAKNVPGGMITQTAITLAKLCRDTLFEFGVGAKIACENNLVTPALERVVEANTLLSGLGFESGAVALAHALSEGLTTIPEAHTHTHGELVAFGLLAQLLLEGRDHETVSNVFEFCNKVGLPTTLAQIGAEPGDELRRAATIAAEPGRPSNNLPFEITPRSVYDALVAADAVGKMYSK
ncbi:MAG: glycerol dehydrogenase [Oscillospiraceae bacterium]|jgi:glycerol dehydrogenase|nr:glycerol dehydrogenase [Oscillospiraceae bacterium]